MESREQGFVNLIYGLLTVFQLARSLQERAAGESGGAVKKKGLPVPPLPPPLRSAPGGPRCPPPPLPPLTESPPLTRLSLRDVSGGLLLPDLHPLLRRLVPPKTAPSPASRLPLCRSSARCVCLACANHFAKKASCGKLEQLGPPCTACNLYLGPTHFFCRTCSCASPKGSSVPRRR